MSTDQQAVEDRHCRSWVEIRPGALRRNLRRIRNAVGASSAIIPVVKADGYGLGMESVVRALEPEDPWGYGVATVEEGARLRAAGVAKPIVVMSPLPPGAYDLAVAQTLTPTVSEMDAVRRLEGAVARAGRAGRFHVEIDSGMGRAGFDWRRVADWGPALSRCMGDQLVWEGCYTHFHSADVAGDDATLQQWQRFRAAVHSLAADGSRMIHACNGTAALRYPGLVADAVRPGIFLYGGSAGEGVDPPEEVAQLRACVTLVREVPGGTTLGYGATYRACGVERWATLGIGYGDGFPRCLGNRSSALLHGRRVPIIGRISMDMTVVNISGVDGVSVGDIATLIGTDGAGRITVDQVAELAGTISYEILTGLTRRLPRFVVGTRSGV